MMPRRVRNALFIAFLGHGLFIISARYRLSYDAFTHMLFANHYAESWFSLWETRWYTGFTVVSYPPLTHQLIALFVPLLGFEKAYALILWVITAVYPMGIYAFSRIFTGKSSAAYAALASAILLPIYVTAHIFGQLPFLASTLLALFSAASLNRYLREGGLHNFLLTVSLYATTMALHHATLLVEPFLVFAVAFSYILSTTRGIQLLQFILRLLLICASGVLFSLLVIWPFWQWGRHQTMQAPIDHLSRHNFFTDPLALAIFFFPMYGPLVLCIPFLVRKWHPRFSGLLVSFIVLFLLGLGGTTPLPSLFLGKSWEWLTYDRFAFWACLILTPFFGILYVGLKRKFRLNSKLTPNSLRWNLVPGVTFAFFAVTALGSWLTPFLFPVQPNPVNMQPIVDFLNVENRSQYRYLTFGFGDQFAYLNLLTQATTIDGSYHTARMLPELRESGIGQIDTVYWALKGVPAIEPILKKSGEYGVRWGFVNRKEFIPELEMDGWLYLKTLDNGIQVWENPSAILPEPSNPPETTPFASFSWGVFPMLSFISASALGGLRVWPVQTQRTLRGIHAWLVGLIPAALCFWYYRTMAAYPRDRVYFTYTDALFFLSDALVLVAIILWLSAKIAQPLQLQAIVYKCRTRRYTFHFLFFVICILSTLSILWSPDWRTSLYISFHFWLVFLLILSLSDWSDAWKPAMYGFCAALSLHLITGFVGFALQSTAFLEPLKMKWPGVIDLSMTGIPVVQVSDGPRILRAYGMLPHPNILGGFVLVSLLGPASLFLTGKHLNHPALVLSALGASVLALTFSRSAWLGLMVFSLILILKAKYLDLKRLSLLLITTALGFGITLFPYRQSVQARTVSITSNSEVGSLAGRVWLNQEATQMIRTHPLMGVGIGSFIIQLATSAPEGYPIEPAHNLILLAGAELGLPGALVVIALAISFSYQFIQTQHPNAILAGAAITGLGVISLFDHYLWTLAPGRLLLGLALGLFVGQFSHDEASHFIKVN